MKKIFFCLLIAVFCYPLSASSLYAPNIYAAASFLKHDTLTFAPTRLGNTTIDSVLLVNEQPDTLTIDRMYSNDENFSAVSFLSFIKPNDSVYLKVRFRPKTAGVRTGMILFTIGSPGREDTLFVRGVGAVAVLNLSSTVVSFGSVLIGTAKDTVVGIRNTGWDTLKITDIRSNSSVFQSISRYYPPIPPGGSFIDTIRVQPTTLGTVQSQIIISSNSVSGEARIDLDAYFIGTPRLALSTPCMEFGDIELESFRDAYVTIANSGSDTLTISSISATDSSFRSLTERLVIPPGCSVQDTVRYAPLAAGPINASIVFHHNGIGTSDTIRVSGNGIPLNWKKIDLTGFNSLPIRLMVSPKGDIFIGTGSDGIFRSTDQGRTWKQINHGIINYLSYPYILDLACSSAGELFATADRNGFYHSTDNGDTWQGLTVVSDGEYVSWLSIDRDDALYVVLNNSTNSRIIHSRNSGKTWDNIDIGISRGYTIKLFGSSTGTMFAGITSQGIYRADKGTSQWTNVISLEIPSTLCSFAESRNGTLFVVLGDKGMYRSRDGGLSWEHVTQVFEGMGLYHIGVAADGAMLVSTSGFGIYRSIDEGDHWQPFGAGVRNCTVYSTAASPDGSTYALTSKGLFKAVGSITRVKYENTIAPSTDALQNNYPNPFNPSTTIGFSLAAPGMAAVTIVDVLGRTVAELVRQPMSAGFHTVTWNAAGFRSGIYFCRFQTEHYTSTKKLLLIK